MDRPLIQPEQHQSSIIKVLLRPVVRFCAKHTVSFQEIIQWVKAEFIRVSAQALEAQGKKITVSQLSVMTGINRREVAAVLEGGEPAVEEFHFIRRITGQWEQDKDFCTKAGKPKTLDYKGKNSEFAKLVARVSRDLSPAAVLKELMRLELVRTGSRGVTLLKPVVPLSDDPSKTIGLFASDIDVFTRVVETNIYSTQTVRNAHLRTEYDNLFKEDLPYIKEWLLNENKIFHKRLREFLAKYDADINPDSTKEGGGSAVVSSFSFTDVDD